MAYVAVTGGKEAIAESIRLLQYHRCATETPLALEAVEKSMDLLIHRVMGEAGFYCPAYAALALKQCEGSVEEAVFLLRAYRSTLTRSYYSLPVDCGGMRLIRRISSVFKDVKGGQMLGPAYDYTYRILDFGLCQEDAAQAHRQAAAILAGAQPRPLERLETVSQGLRDQGLIHTPPENGEEPFDVTMENLEFPCPRSARLQVLARGDTGFVTGIAYSALRGYGFSNHPTIGELRSGYVDLTIPYLFAEGEQIDLGELLLTQVVSYTALDDGEAPGSLTIKEGFGMVFGRCESKAIAISILDTTLDEPGDAPCNNEEFVLMHGDMLEMNGYISHLKLPHYVTFQSKLSSVRKSREKGGAQP